MAEQADYRRETRPCPKLGSFLCFCRALLLIFVSEQDGSTRQPLLPAPSFPRSPHDSLSPSIPPEPGQDAAAQGSRGAEVQMQAGDPKPLNLDPEP